ncbi:MAG TPA: hypothetical protein ENJ87_13050 [Gammaproteobacteria bacterium]|nr:hypothetical protein [Gammaproteobacteria bacterium]
MIVKTKKSMYRSCVVPVLMGIAVAFSAAVGARQLDDVTLPDTVTLDGTDVALQLNGMGYRTKFVFNIYVGALYTESKVKSRDAAQALSGPKRIVMHMVYDEVSHEKMADAWKEGFEDNSSDEQFKKLLPRLNTFISYFPDLKENDVILLDYIPASGTQVTINGEAKAVIAGADFYTALLDVWLGEEPADEDLKEAMLGEEDDD